MSPSVLLTPALCHHSWDRWHSPQHPAKPHTPAGLFSTFLPSNLPCSSGNKHSLWQQPLPSTFQPVVSCDGLKQLELCTRACQGGQLPLTALCSWSTTLHPRLCLTLDQLWVLSTSKDAAPQAEEVPQQEDSNEDATSIILI